MTLADRMGTDYQNDDRGTVEMVSKVTALRRYIVISYTISATKGRKSG